MFSLAEN